MKRILFSILLSIPFILVAQDYDQLGKAFSEGQATSIVKWMSTTVDFSLLGEDDKMDKKSCETQLKKFFLSNSPKSFTKVHDGVSGNDIHYMIGELVTENGTYRVTAYLRKKDDKFKIKSLEIDK